MATSKKAAAWAAAGGGTKPPKSQQNVVVPGPAQTQQPSRHQQQQPSSSSSRLGPSKDSEASLQTQKEELEALSSIFGDDLKMEKPIWGNASFNILIRLLGQDSLGASLANCALELGITYTAKYPKTPPLVEVRRPRHQQQQANVSSSALSDDDLRSVKALLLKEADKWSHENQGNPFLFELIRVAQDYLAEKSKTTRQPAAIVAPSISSKQDERDKTDTQIIAAKVPTTISSALTTSESNDSLLLEEEARAKKREAWRQEQLQTVDSSSRSTATSPIIMQVPAKPDATAPVVVASSGQGGKRGGRYVTDFEELGAVGRGGFGHVYKARNRLDGMIYAVKKIRLEHDEALNRKTRNEATTLAKLVHPNIVRYFAAWVEEDDDGNSTDGEDESDEEDEFPTDSAPSLIRPASSFTGFLSQEGDDEDDTGLGGGFEWDVRKSITNEDDDDDDGEEEEHVEGSAVSSFGYDDDEEEDGSGSRLSSKAKSKEDELKKSQLGIKQQQGKKEELKAEAAVKAKSDHQPVAFGTDRKQTLYIVMEFVPRTVRALVASRELLGQDHRCFELIREILEALSCIHELQIIHQDIKPENLLIDAQGKVKLGDFGLAVDQEAKDRDGAEVGTTYYRAPEVGKGKWDEKCDIFSLGVVVVEMFSPPTDTNMERHKLLTNLRLDLPVLPQGLNEEAAQLARQMLQKDPAKRPSAAQALKAIPGHIFVEHAVDTVVKSLVPSSNAYARLLKHLFSQDPSPEVDATFDYDPAQEQSAGDEDAYFMTDSRFASRAYNELAALGALPLSESLVPVNREISSNLIETAAIQVFDRIGATRFRVPLLIPSSINDTSGEIMLTPANKRKVVTLLDSSGIAITLPHATLTRSLARFVALNREIRFLKRYDVGWAFTRAGGGGQPIQYKQFCYDFICGTKDLEPLVGDSSNACLSEICDSVREVLSSSAAVSNPSSGITVEIGHVQFLPLMFDLAKVPKDVRPVILQKIRQKEYFRDWKECVEILTTECKCPIGSVQLLKFCLPIGKRNWIPGTNGEILPTWSSSTAQTPGSKSGAPSIFQRDSSLDVVLSQVPPLDLIHDSNETGGADDHHHNHHHHHNDDVAPVHGSKRKGGGGAGGNSKGGQSSSVANPNPSSVQQQSSNSSLTEQVSTNQSSAAKFPLDLLIEHAQTTFAKHPQQMQPTVDRVLDILRELSKLALHLQSGFHQHHRVRVVFWCEPPHDVTGLYFRCMVRQRRAAVRGGAAGLHHRGISSSSSKANAVQYDEGPEFVASDGGRFEDLISSYKSSSSSSMKGRGLIGFTARIYLDRVAKLRAFASVEGMMKRPLIRLCAPLEKDAGKFDCEDRARCATKLRTELAGIGVEWMHPSGLSGEALLALCREEGARVMISRVSLQPVSSSSSSSAAASSSSHQQAQIGNNVAAGGAGASIQVIAASLPMLHSQQSGGNNSVIVGLEQWRVRGWAFPASADLSNPATMETNQHLGVFTDRRCDTWSELVRTVAQMIAFNKMGTTGGLGSSSAT